MTENLELFLLCVRMVIFMVTLGTLWMVLFTLRKGKFYAVAVPFMMALSLLLANLVYGRTKTLLGLSSQSLGELSILLALNIVAGVCIIVAVVNLRHIHE